MATTMPAARPDVARTRRCKTGTQAPTPAQFRPGQLLRSATGLTFRVAKDATRIHYADSFNRRNVIRLDDVPAGQAIPTELLRAMLTMFPDRSARTGTHRCWRVRLVDETWNIALELRGSRGRLTFPEGTGSSPTAAGLPVEADDHVSVTRVTAHLWACADRFEADSSQPADLGHLRQLYGAALSS